MEVVALAIQLDGARSSFRSRTKHKSFKLLYQIQATGNVVGDVGDDKRVCDEG